MFSAHKSFSNGDLGEDVSINSGQFVIIVIYYNYCYFNNNNN